MPLHNVKTQPLTLFHKYQPSGRMVPKTHQWNDKRDPGLPHYVSSSGKWRKCNVPKQQEHLSGGKPPSLTRGILSDFQ